MNKRSKVHRKYVRPGAPLGLPGVPPGGPHGGPWVFNNATVIIFKGERRGKTRRDIPQ